MARRSRKGRPDPQQQPTPTEPSPPPAPARETLRRGYARSRARDEAVRASLEPLAPGERPGPLVAGAIVAATLGVLNVALLAADVQIEGRSAKAGGVLALSAVLLLAAAGMWLKRYWAVLGFEVLLGITIAFAALSLLVASNVAGVALCVAIVGLGGWLFWKLVRVMARLQAATRRPRNEVR